ncbi:MAG: TIGR03854 family LLM class F420-dependent oxidoreductase [Streptosporangiaceae bacterium]|jgi:probable F420-dependent oxidoreductase
MKIRIGIGLGAGAGPDGFAAAVDHLEELGIDSLWLSEMVYGPLVEPFTGMAYALARTARLKVGTGVSVLPGRHPVLVAKQLASLAALAPGRVLPVFGLQPARTDERGLFPVPPGQRGAVFDESLELLRLLLRQETVSFSGAFFTVEDASVGPLPRKPLDIWLGGSAPAGLRRAGRYGDGWLASFVTPAEARAGIRAIQAAAAAADREVDPEHFGISLPVALGGIPAALAAAIGQRRPDADPADLVATSWPDARRMVAEYVAAGISKFVIRPAAAARAGGDVTGDVTGDFADGLARELMPVQT